MASLNDTPDDNRPDQPAPNAAPDPSTVDDPSPNTTASADSRAFRALMRRVPSPVVVVTAAAGNAVRGITIGSFTSLELDPPLIMFNVDQEASMHSLMERADRFAVHILAEDQAHLAEHFAIPDTPGEEQLAPVPHERDAHGTPILEGVTGVLRCVPYTQFATDGNTVYVGRVVDVDARTDRGAVLYYKQSYRGVGSELEVKSSLLSPVNRSSSESS
jgi:flavin reductase (DIM6/NTAB) family NADH-FMN oxidoreductase RutF